jgi:hypothetical protein
MKRKNSMIHTLTTITVSIKKTVNLPIPASIRPHALTGSIRRQISHASIFENLKTIGIIVDGKWLLRF